MTVGNVWLTDFAPIRPVINARPLGHGAMASATRLLEMSLAEGFVETVDSLWLNGKQNCVAHLDGLQLFVRLKSLSLQNSGIKNRDLKHVARLWQLEELLLTNNLDINDAGAAKLESMRNVKYLSLEWTGITDAALRSIAKLASLQELAIGGPWLTGSRVAELQALPALEKLTLIGDRIDSNCLEQLKTFPALTCLCLGLTSINDDGLEHIQSLLQLQTVQLPATVSDQAAAQLARALPGCMIR